MAATSTLQAALLVAVAAAPVSHGCRAPRAQLEATVLEATRPALVMLRCRTRGFRGRPRFIWKLPPGARPFTSNEPLDEDALLVQLVDSPRAAELVKCEAVNEPDSASAEVALGPSQVTAARAAAATPGATPGATTESTLTVDGSGFTVERGADDGVWLVPPRGLAVRADSSCKPASWGDSRVVVCLPKLTKRSYQVRVQSGGRLAVGPSLSLGGP